MSYSECAICLGVFSDAVIASCGHSFCASCIIHQWENTDVLIPVNCPIDRSVITFIIPNYALRSRVDAQQSCTSEVDEVDASEKGNIGSADDSSLQLSKLSKYNSLFRDVHIGTRQRLKVLLLIVWNQLNFMSIYKCLSIILMVLGLVHVFIIENLVSRSDSHSGGFELLEDLLVISTIAFCIFNILLAAEYHLT